MGLRLTNSYKSKGTEMFRGKTKSPMMVTTFGVGSKITGSNTENYVVIGEQGSIKLLDLNTFTVLRDSTPVEDENFLSEIEVRVLIRQLPGAMSDYDFDPKGLKDMWNFQTKCLDINRILKDRIENVRN